MFNQEVKTHGHSPTETRASGLRGAAVSDVQVEWQETAEEFVGFVVKY
jgi:hypothetical protein